MSNYYGINKIKTSSMTSFVLTLSLAVSIKKKKKKLKREKKTNSDMIGNQNQTKWAVGQAQMIKYTLQREKEKNSKTHKRLWEWLSWWQQQKRLIFSFQWTNGENMIWFLIKIKFNCVWFLFSIAHIYRRIIDRCMWYVTAPKQNCVHSINARRNHNSHIGIFISMFLFTYTNPNVP